MLFQPAEEEGPGAQRMVEAGALTEKYGGRRVAAMFGMHRSPLLPVGMVASKPGPLLAGCCDFDIVLHRTGRDPALAPPPPPPPPAAPVPRRPLDHTLLSRN